MNYRFIVLLIFIYISFSFHEYNGAEKGIKDFRLKNVNNKMVSLSDYKDAKGFVIVFMSNKCPMAKLYTQRLNTINDRFKKQHVYVLAINAMDTLAYSEESFRMMQKKAVNDKMTVPYLQDRKQSVAKQFKASHTPEAFVIWKETGKNYQIKYHGSIDDNASEPEKATPYLINSIKELLNGKPVTLTTTESFGCRIFYRGQKQKMN